MKRFLILTATMAGLLLGGCYSYPVQDGAYVDEEPPAPYVEVVPARPYGDAIWIPGYWAWNGATNIWIDGAWRVPPRRSYVWVKSGWVRDGSRYRYVQGRWAAPHRVPRHEYVSRPARPRPAPVVRHRNPRGPQPAPPHRPSPR